MADIGPGVSQDAVVVVPGIMGSELRDTATGDLIWGLRRVGWYVDAWTRGASLRTLQVTDEERAGRTGRVQPVGLLKVPAFAPMIAGIEPYTRLVRRIEGVVADPAAVLAFPYDWRLPVEYNAALLATAATEHLRRWRRHPMHESARRTQADDRPGRLVLVAHSMGGLLCRALGAIPGATDDVRAVVTLGTPLDGAAKAAVILNTGRGGPVPLPRRRMRELAATLPGIHDLLPSYRCVDDGADVRRLTPADVSRLGGDSDLARAAQDSHRRLAEVPIIGHRAVVGLDQPTVQSLVLRDGVVHAQNDTFRVRANGELVRDNGALVRIQGSGDGTVPRNSAMPAGTHAIYLPQQHGALSKTDEAIAFACAVITESDHTTGARLGDGDVGLDVPDVVEVGTDWTARVTGVEPGSGECAVTDVETGQPVDHPPLRPRDGGVVATVNLDRPGIYRVTVSAGSMSPVSQLVMATA